MKHEFTATIYDANGQIIVKFYGTLQAVTIKAHCAIVNDTTLTYSIKRQ